MLLPEDMVGLNLVYVRCQGHSISLTRHAPLLPFKLSTGPLLLPVPPTHPCLVVLRFTWQLLISEGGNNSCWSQFTSFLVHVEILEKLTIRIFIFLSFKINILKRIHKIINKIASQHQYLTKKISYFDSSKMILPYLSNFLMSLGRDVYGAYLYSQVNKTLALNLQF